MFYYNFLYNIHRTLNLLVILGHVSNDKPGVIRCLIIIHPSVTVLCPHSTPRIPPTNPLPSLSFFYGLENVLDGFPHLQSSNSKFEHWPAKFLHPISICLQRAFQVFALALLRSLASSIQASQGTVSSSSTTCLVDPHVNTISGQELKLPSQVNLKLPVTRNGDEPSWGAGLVVCLLPHSDEGDWLLQGDLGLAVLYCCPDGMLQDFKNLVMVPLVPSFPECPWAAAQNVFHGAPPLTQLTLWIVCQVPVIEVDWDWEDFLHHWLYEELCTEVQLSSTVA